MTPICTRFARLVAPLALAASAVSAAHAQETRSGAGSRVAEFLEEVASIVERRENG